ncbi:MAG: hypothetical protein II714_03520, partial [Oscillospiraceae bacterium]|nr:hypothetical protein [Oscillospiraceae bacterium]
MVLGIVITPIIALIAPAKDKERVAGIFSCYNKKVTVSSKKAIIEDEPEDESAQAAVKAAKAQSKSKNSNPRKKSKKK